MVGTGRYLSEISATLLSISDKKHLQSVVPQRQHNIFLLRITLCQKLNFVITHLHIQWAIYLYNHLVILQQKLDTLR